MREALGDHDIYCIATRPAPRSRASAAAGSPRPTTDTREGGPAPHASRPSTSPARSARTSSSGRGSRATTTRSRRRTRRAGRGSSTGIGEAAERCRGARRHPLPRAQELGAGDEDPHAQHRHDAARDPQAARRGHRQRQGEHGLAAPDHERREPRRVRGDARRRGPARPPARELGLGHVRRRQHGRRDRVHGDARARRRAAPRRLRRERRAARLRPLPVHGGRRSPRSGAASSSGASSTRSPAGSTTPRSAQAQQEKDAVRAYELVYAALGAE